MECICGYSFAEADLEALQAAGDAPDLVVDGAGFAVIRNRDYQTFLSLDQKVLAATTEEESLSCITESAQFVGSLRQCPECTRLILSHPDLEVPSGCYVRQE